MAGTGRGIGRGMRMGPQPFAAKKQAENSSPSRPDSSSQPGPSNLLDNNDFPPLTVETQYSSKVKTESRNKTGLEKTPKWMSNYKPEGVCNEATLKQQLISLDSSFTNDKQKTKLEFRKLLKDMLVSSNNMFEAALYFIQNSCDLHVHKTMTRAFYIASELESLVKKSEVPDDWENLLSESIRQRALYCCTWFHTVFFDKGLVAFQLCHTGNEYQLPYIKQLVEVGKFKEAALCVGKLKLQENFTLNEIFVPLLLEDKVNLLEIYLEGNPSVQKEAVKFIDTLCDRKTDYDSFIRSYKVKKVVREKIHWKPLSKLAARLAKLYGIPLDECPSVSHARALGAMRFLLHKYYIEQSIAVDGWHDMVEGTVGDNKELQKELVTQVHCYNDVDEAAQWAIFYNLSDEDIPTNVAQKRENILQREIASPAKPVVEDDWDSECFSEEAVSACYYKLKLPLDAISIVDNAESFEQAISKLSQLLIEHTPLHAAGTTIGVDSEWKPSFTGQTQKTALLQMAVKDHVYLFDMWQLMSCMDSTRLGMLVRLFCDPAVLKLGYGFDADIHMLIKTFPSIKDQLAQIKRFVDMEKLSKLVVDKVINLIPDTGSDDEDPPDDDSGVMIKFQEQEEKGLSEVVRQVLGKPLEKKEQMSNWEKRPLRTSQMVYAALDAYVLLELHEVYLNQAEKEKLQIDLEPSISMRWLKPSKAERKKTKAQTVVSKDSGKPVG